MAQSWKCIAMEFGDKDNAGLVAFWMQMSAPYISKANADLASAAPDLLEALKERISADRCEAPIRKPLPNPRGFMAHNELLNCGSCGYCKALAAIAKTTVQKEGSDALQG